MNFVAWVAGNQICFDGAERGCHSAFNDCNSQTSPDTIREIINKTSFLKEIKMFLLEDFPSHLLNEARSYCSLDSRIDLKKYH